MWRRKKFPLVTKMAKYDIHDDNNNDRTDNNDDNDDDDNGDGDNNKSLRAGQETYKILTYSL